MKKISEIVNGNKGHVIATVTIIVSLMLASLYISSAVNNVKADILKAVDQRIDIHNRLYDAHPKLMEQMIDLNKKIECNQREILELLKKGR